MKPQHILGKYLGKVGHSVRRPKGILSPVCTQLRWMSCMQWCVWVCVRRALKVKQDVFSGRRPFQSRQIPDNLSKFPPLISASNNSALFVPPTVCSKVGNRRRGNLGHSSPRCEQSIPSNSAIPKISSSTSPPRSESDRTPGSGCSGRRNLRRQCRCRG